MCRRAGSSMVVLCGGISMLYANCVSISSAVAGENRSVACAGVC